VETESLSQSRHVRKGRVYEFVGRYHSIDVLLPINW